MTAHQITDLIKRLIDEVEGGGGLILALVALGERRNAKTVLSD